MADYVVIEELARELYECGVQLDDYETIEESARIMGVSEMKLNNALEDIYAQEGK